MRALHFSVAHRTKGTKQAPAQAHVRYITRAQAGAEAHVGYVTRTTQETREDLVATGYGNLPAWAGDDPAAFFAEADRWERLNGRTATQITAMLPRGMDREDLVSSVETFVRSQLGTAHAYVWGIHETQASDGGRHPHVHIAFSERPTQDGMTPQEYFSKANPKETTFHQRPWPYAARQAWSDTLNVSLEAAGVVDRVSARSFKDQGMDWQTSGYIDRQTLQRDKSLLHQRAQVADTPEALATRTQEWEARKHALGITRDMARDEITQRIGDASRERRQTPIEVPQQARAIDIEAAHAKAQEKLAQVRALRQAEEHYSTHPQELRPPAHLAAIATVLHEDAQDHGRVRRRGRQRDDEQERTRTQTREW